MHAISGSRRHNEQFAARGTRVMAAVVVDQWPAVDLACRGLHLVDLENLLADPWARGACVGHALDEYLTRARFRRGDLVFVAGNPWLMVELGWSQIDSAAPVECHRFAARGPQGADNKLLEAAPLAWVARRFDRLVVGSGDGVFADRLAAARASGLSVRIVSRPEALSGRLARLDVPTEWFVGDDVEPGSARATDAPVRLQRASRPRTSARRSIDRSTSRWSSARCRTITSVPPTSASPANASATLLTLPQTGASGLKPR
jgi:hypothetical protein